MTPEVRQILEEQRRRFIEKFGREPGPKDPVFFDPESDVSKPMDSEVVEREMTEAMKRAGIPADKIYAYRKTGILLTERVAKERPDLVAEWNAAIEEWWRTTH